MLSAAAVLPGSAAACLPHRCRQSLSQLPSLASWSLQLSNSQCQRAIATAVRAETMVQDPAASAVGPAQKLPAFLAELQNRQTGQLRSPIVDQQGRLMLKNLTKAELADWFEMQGTHLRLCDLHESGLMYASSPHGSALTKSIHILAALCWVCSRA